MTYEIERRKCQSRTAFELQDKNHDYRRNKFNIDYADIKIVEDFAYFGLVLNSSGDSTQEIKRRPRFGRAAMKDLGKITDILLETKVKIIHTLIF